MTTEERDLIRQLPPLFNGYDSKCAATTGLPIDGNVAGVDLNLRTISAVGTIARLRIRRQIISASASDG